MQFDATQTIQLNLPSDMIASLEKIVESGRYHTPSEVLYTAFLQWQERQKIMIEELQRLCDEGMASGIAEPFTIEELLAEIHGATGNNDDHAHHPL